MKTSHTHEQATGTATRQLLRYPQYQALTIASHYLTTAPLAQRLRTAQQTGNVDLIHFLVQEIKAAHQRDLDLPLEWPPVS